MCPFILDRGEGILAGRWTLMSALRIGLPAGFFELHCGVAIVEGGA
jgi:hypothetical protein